MDLHHPKRFKFGVHVLSLVSRKKDLGVNSGENHISYDHDQFDEILSQLRDKKTEGQRIYATASSLDLEKARRKFREAQLQSEYDADPLAFYRSIQNRWTSAVARSELHKRWLFDCDTQGEHDSVIDDLKRIGVQYYDYDTKQGKHVVVEPFNRSRLLYEDAKRCLHTNPLMLWSY